MIKTYKKAFTLAETLLTMIIIATFLLAITPVVIKTKSTPTEAPWKYVTLGDNSQNAAIYGSVDGSAVSVIGDKRVPIDTNISADKPEVFATKINPKISIAAKNHIYNPLISRHLIDFYEKDASIDDMFYNIGKISFDNDYNLAVGKNSLDNVVTSSTANFSNFSDNTLWTDLTDESDSNLKAALNTAVGQYAMGGDRKYLSNSPEYPTRNMSGGANTAVGAFAMRRNTTGDLNTAIGAYALESATDTDTGKGSRNIAIGYKALRVNSGDDNIAVGREALVSNQTGNQNIAMGSGAMYSIDGANYGIAIGYKSMYSCSDLTTTDNNNIAVGSKAMYNAKKPIDNIAIGSEALYSNQDTTENTDNTYNVAIGYRTLYENKEGSSNIAIGSLSMENNVTGSTNVVAGYKTLNANTSGSACVAIGSQALENNTTGSENIAIGVMALNSNTTGEQNVAFGYETLSVNTTGNNNVAIGVGALKNSTGSSNTAIGYMAGANNGSNSNRLYISANGSFMGNDALIYGEDVEDNRILKFSVTDGQAYLGSISDNNKIATMLHLKNAVPKGAFDLDFQNNRIAYSDRRLKNIIGDNKSGLKEILQLKVKNYTLKNDANKEPKVGVIAQDLQKVFSRSVFKGVDGYLRIKQDEIFYACVNAIKELHSMITGLIDKIAMLDKKITKIEKQNVLNEKKLSAIKQQNKIIDEELNALEKELSK